MKTKLLVTLLGALLAGTVGLTGDAFAQGNGNGNGNGGGGGGAVPPDYGDLIILYRDSTGVPILDENFCQQPIGFPENVGCPIPVGCDGADPCLIPTDSATCGIEPLYASCANEADFGRVNLSRASDRVLASQLQDVLVNLAIADCTTLDPAGRLVYSRIIGTELATGTIDSLGKWALRTACRQNKAWQSAGFGAIRMAVNVSGHQFRSREFVRQVRLALEKTGVAPHCLTLELTEGVMIEDAKENIEVLHALKDMGVKLSVDDFGTGYSSLSYLEQFPLDELKVDRSFISKIELTTGEAPIVSAIIAMARSLRFTVVAEGVETEQQLAFLRKHNCEQYQGYLFSKPLPADEFAELVAHGRPDRI